MRFAWILIVAIFLNQGNANAQGIVGAAANGKAIAIAVKQVLPGDVTEWEILLGREGTPFRRVFLVQGRWLLDMHVLDDGTVLLASAEQRGQEIRVRRVEPGAKSTETVIAGSDSNSDVFFKFHGPKVVLLTAFRAFLSDNQGRSFQARPKWYRDPPGMYSFYAASSSLTPQGTLDLLWPAFNTCESADRLEGFQRIRLTRDGSVTHETLSMKSLGEPVKAFMGRYGVIYTARHLSPDTAVLQAHERGRVSVVHRVAGAARLMGAENGRYVVSIVGSDVLRLNGAKAQKLGTLASTESIFDIYPDDRGRALVLTEKALVRYSSSEPPVELWKRVDATED
jgi:hypothetical protein